ncbi:MAG TPA: phosphocholine cytidylyltransferase family protein [Desulfobacterales bacterium]|nr:phosphocholine cytidylyltransferase family protein [Desulfobacterales bacterium]
MVKLAVILAAGSGVRINNRSDEKPKGFLEIDNETLIERSIDFLLKHKIEKIIIGTGYLSHFYERLKEKYPNVMTQKNDFYDKTSSFYTLHNMKDIINEDFLLLESDLIYEERAITHLQRSKKKDIILASGRTNSQDEVFIETDTNMMLVNISKKKDDLKKIDGELVGVSKISFQTFQNVCALYTEDDIITRKTDYEIVFAKSSQIYPITIERIDDLVWTEIDNQHHLHRAINLILPKLKNKECVPSTPCSSDLEHFLRE